MKKRRYGRLIILLLIICSAIGGYFYLNNNKSNDLNKVKIVNKVDGYSYQLTDNNTKLYKKYFKQLNKVLTSNPIVDKDYAELVVKMFVADFYDLNSKVSKNDIGGLDFIYKGSIDNFKLNAQNTIYKYVENNVYKDRKQVLPAVDSVEVTSVEPSEIKLNDKPYDGFLVDASWTYKKELGYEKSGRFELAKEGKYLYIIKMD